MAKISKSFRLSEQAQANLRQLSEQSGASETAIVEMALAYFVNVLRSQPPDTPAVPEPDAPPDDWLPHPTAKQPIRTNTHNNSRKKKRR